MGAIGGEHVSWRGRLLERLAERVGLKVAAGLRHHLEVDLFEADADAAHVGQVPGANHLRDPALVDDLLPHLAEQLAVGALRGGGHPEDQRRGLQVREVLRYDRARGVMSFVDNDGVELSREPLEPACPGERLDAADDDGRADVVALRGDKPDAEPERRVGERDLRCGLAQQLVAVREHEGASGPLAISEANTTVFPVPWKDDHRRRTPRSSACSTAVIASCW